MTKDGTVKKLKVYYTNADQLLNKMMDLKVHIYDRQPDVMVVTEVIPKLRPTP